MKQADRLSPSEKADIEARFGRYVNKGQVRYLKAGHLDLIETEREGISFVDQASGRRVVDAFTSAGCFNVGRHNPEIMAVLDQAVDELDLGSYRLISPMKVALARKLTELAPGDLNRILFAAGGGDAIDCAIKLARGATGRTGIISTVKAYHGHTGLALSANGKPHYRDYCEPLAPGFDFAPFNDLEAIRKLASEETAAILIEPVQGEAGIFVGTTEYLQGLRDLADELDILLIFDEIQTGMGRTGKLFACEHSGVVPDIMTVAKSLGGGLFPNAAVLYRDLHRLVEFVESDPYFHPSVTGGSDLGCRVSLAVLNYIEQNRLWENAEKQGARLRAALDKLHQENPKIVKEVRGVGMMIGIEYIHEFLGPMMADALAKNGVFAAYSGNAPQVMRFMLSLVIDDREMDRVIETINKAIGQMKTMLPLALPAAKIPALLKLLNDEKVQTVLFGMLRKVEDVINRGLDLIRGEKR